MFKIRAIKLNRDLFFLSYVPQDFNKFCMITMITTGYHVYRVSTVALVSLPPHNCLRSPYVITNFYPNISCKQHFCWPKFFGVSAAARAEFGATYMESLHCTIRQFAIRYKWHLITFPLNYKNHTYCKSFNELIIERVPERKCPESIRTQYDEIDEVFW
jgi:hypothetical protein